MIFCEEKMNMFEEYLTSNWTVEGAVGIEKKYSHSLKKGVDKKTEREILNHNVVIGLKYFDKNNVLLKSESIKFVNNELCTASKKKLINIAPAELTNRFMAGKQEIVERIMYEYDNKKYEIVEKMKDLMNYSDTDSVGCNAEFKGERVEIGGMAKKNKAVFDM